MLWKIYWWFILALTLMSLGIDCAKNGQPNDGTHRFGIAVFAVLVNVPLFYFAFRAIWGG